MLLQPGKTYVLTLQVEGLVNGTDWLPTAVTGTYPVTVLGQGPDRPSHGNIESDVVARWNGAATDVQLGGVVSSADIPTIGAATATLTNIVEQTEAVASSTNAWLEIGASVGILGFVSYMIYRMGKHRRKTS